MIIFSINVHEKIDFLIKQLRNINYYVSLNYIVLINANNAMYNKLKKCDYIISQTNIVLNPYYFNKSRNHGSLTKGIYSNMKYAINNYRFKYLLYYLVGICFIIN